jgi:(p)ppGpp synthase/HD superfamily hydrolase
VTERTASEPVRVEGFGSGASAYGNSPLDTLTLPLYTTGKSLETSKSHRGEPDILEAREKILRLAEEANGIFSVANEKMVDTAVGTSADELLRGAQARYRVFYAPVVVKAFRMAEEAHKGQFRRNGDSFLLHCMETALILAATGVDSSVVAAGLLHDAIDDSNLSLQLLRGALGEDVANLVIGVSRLSNLSQLARNSNTVCDPTEADRLRTMILAMVDVRVVLIKIADRLHNLRTLEALPSLKQIGMANETLEIFAPLANRLGIWSWKAELEDLCFKCLKPAEYQDLSTRLSERCREGIVMSSIEDLEEALKIRGVQFIDLCGRPKNLYSVYKKMMKKKRTPEEILDVRGLRLIVADENSCYKALEIVHELWRQIPGKSKDYIVESKPNGYKSLHTVVTGSDGYPLEVQIRTMKMHHQAEYGLAAHWRYKEDNTEHSAFSSERVEWARWVLTWHSEITDTKLRVSSLGADLRPPCPFPVHNEGCPYDASCCGLMLREDDPVFVIKMENEHMLVRELSPGSTVGDLVSVRSSDMDSLTANLKSAEQNEVRVKVNHQFVDDLEQKLNMGDYVEVTTAVQRVLETSVVRSSAVEKPCGKIALEFQREQLKRLYGGISCDDLRTPSLERSSSVAGLI